MSVRIKLAAAYLRLCICFRLGPKSWRKIAEQIQRCSQSIKQVIHEGNLIQTGLEEKLNKCDQPFFCQVSSAIQVTLACLISADQICL
jgi:hypothetical protein